MKIPALKARIGDWDYYVTTLTFEQVNKYVSRIDDQLHKSEGLKDMIQRSITDNYKSIRDYIVNQNEMFFSSLVLAVYDHYPDWREIEFRYDEDETYQMGLLEFPGEHKIFPVDGQHRVEGIKAALFEDPKLANQQIAAVFIGHKNDDAGKKRTRRLFTTLNRYAKPVKTDDIIALDEDDCAALFTRELLEEYPLFSGKRVVYTKQKAIPTTNKDAITSIITLYQANIEILRYFLLNKEGKKRTPKRFEEFLKFRPSEDLITEYRELSYEFWEAFATRLPFIQAYLQLERNAAETYRNNHAGGNLLFRPIGFLPFVKAVLLIAERKQHSFEKIFIRFSTINFSITERPWLYVIWNPVESKMIMSSDRIPELMLLYLYNDDALQEEELTKLKDGYAARTSVEDQGEIARILDDLGR